MRIAVCPGSFDPITYGHLDIINRACKLFDQVVVLVIQNLDKNPSFTAEERVEMIRSVTGEIDNVVVDTFEGLLVDYVKEKQAVAIVKGLRAMSDFEYEFQMALINKKMYPEAETVFLTTSMHNMYLSSSMVRQVARFNGDISGLVPRKLREQVRERLGNPKEEERP